MGRAVISPNAALNYYIISAISSGYVSQNSVHLQCDYYPAHYFYIGLS